MHPNVAAVAKRMFMIPLPSCDTAPASRVIRDVSQAVHSEFFGAQASGELARPWNSALFNLFLLISHAHHLFSKRSLRLPRADFHLHSRAADSALSGRGRIGRNPARRNSWEARAPKFRLPSARGRLVLSRIWRLTGFGNPWAYRTLSNNTLFTRTDFDAVN